MMQTSEIMLHQRLSEVEQEIVKRKKNTEQVQVFQRPRAVAAVGISLLLLRCFCFQYRKMLFKQLLLSAEC